MIVQIFQTETFAFVYLVAKHLYGQEFDLYLR